MLVLIYIDDVLIVRWGKQRVRKQPQRVVEALRAAGGFISPQSTLEPLTRLVWLGKDVDLGGGSLRTAGNTWEALLAHWLRLSVGNCSVRFLGRARWLCRPGFGHCPHLSGVWAHVLWEAPRLQFSPGKLLRSMCVVCVLPLPGWSMVSLPRELGRGLVFESVDAALDGGVYRLGLWSLGLGSRSAVPYEQPPNQQCAEARALLWGLKFILNVGICEAHLFWDNAIVLVQFLMCKASVGRVYQ